MSEWVSGDQLTVPGEMKELGGRVTPLYNNSTNYGQGYKCGICDDKVISEDNLEKHMVWNY